jgi:hypothetical protein
MGRVFGDAKVFNQKRQLRVLDFDSHRNSGHNARRIPRPGHQLRPEIKAAPLLGSWAGAGVKYPRNIFHQKQKRPCRLLGMDGYFWNSPAGVLRICFRLFQLQLVEEFPAASAKPFLIIPAAGIPGLRRATTERVLRPGEAKFARATIPWRWRQP